MERLLQSIEALPLLRRLNRDVLPSPENAGATIEQLLQLVFPGFFGRQNLTSEALPGRVAELVGQSRATIYDHIRFCLRYREARPGDSDFDQRCQVCDQEAGRIVELFFDRLVDVRAMIAHDVQAAFDSDPAATSTDETIFCYPGVFAITIQRLAHELYKLNVPLLPRIWTELAHARTGIDIHPGAKLGQRFFIDHGTAVVIGETTEIGSNVKIYQGVTLGALAPAYGQMLRGLKRHPTIEDDVVIYAHATVLGGDTIIGKGSVIGGNVFLTRSVPAGHVVLNEMPKLEIRAKGGKRRRNDGPDYQI